MNYKELDHDDFDAIVTGELTHYALWLEGALNNIITDYFISRAERRNDFERLFLYRDGLTVQDKIEIVRGMSPSITNSETAPLLKSLLKDIEEFKSWRNALAHGLEVQDEPTGPHIVIDIVGRSGKAKQVTITPESHERKIKEAEQLLKRAASLRTRLKRGK